MTKHINAYTEEWWIAPAGDLLIWARLRIRRSGIAEILDNDGKTLPYDSEDAARAALMDAEFRAFDGLDDDDATAMGFDLHDVEPPRADSDAELRALMIQQNT